MQRQPRYFKDDKEVTAQQALRGGILRDGFSVRVPTIFKDARQHFTDARSYWDHNRAALLVTDARGIGGSEGNKPGFRVLDDNFGRAAKDAALRQHEQYLRDAWRQDAELVEEEDGDDRRECPNCSGSGYDENGETCPRCGGAGEIADVPEEERISDAKRRRRREPEPDDDDSDPPFGSQDRMRTVDEMNAAHQQRMARQLADHALWLSQQWKIGK